MRLTWGVWLAAFLCTGCGFDNDLFLGDPRDLPPECFDAGSICSVDYPGVGDGGAALQAVLVRPRGMALDLDGAILVAEEGNHRIRRIDPDTGAITTLVGRGYPDSSVNTGRPAAETAIEAPAFLGVDASGWIYWIEGDDEQVWGVDPDTGVAQHVAGSDSYGAPTGGTAVNNVDFRNLRHMSVTPDGVLLVSDQYSYRIVALNVTSSDVTIAGVAVAAGQSGLIMGTGITEDPCVVGMPALACSLDDPRQTIVAPDNSLFVVEKERSVIRSVSADGQAVTNYAGQEDNGGFNGDGGPAASARLAGPESLFLDADGRLFISDSGNRRIRMVNTSTGPLDYAGITVGAGEIQTIAGNGNGGFIYQNGSSALQQGLSWEADPVILDRDGNLLIADTYNGVIRRVDAATGTMSVMAGLGGKDVSGYQPAHSSIALLPDGRLTMAMPGPYLMALDPATGDREILAGSGGPARQGDGGAAVDAGYYGEAHAVAPDGTIYVSDAYNHVVRIIETNGAIQTLAGTGDQSSTGDGGPAASATFNGPDGVLVGADGAVFVADRDRIRLINTSNASLTVAGVTVAPGAIDGIAGTGTAAYSGDGGPALAAEMDLESGFNGMLIVDDILYFADSQNHRIRMVNLTDGTIDLFAGTGNNGSGGNGGDALSANIGFPIALAYHDGYLYWSQETGSVVRRVSLSGGPVELVAGSGNPGYFGDGGLAIDANLFEPQGLAITPDGKFLYIADRSRHIRMVKLQ